MRDEGPVWKVTEGCICLPGEKGRFLKHFMPREGHDQICILKSAQTVVRKARR